MFPCGRASLYKSNCESHTRKGISGVPEKWLNDDGKIVPGLVFARGDQIEDLMIVLLDEELDGSVVLTGRYVFAQKPGKDRFMTRLTQAVLKPLHFYFQNGNH